jgi:hypothetical protein
MYTSDVPDETETRKKQSFPERLIQQNVHHSTSTAAMNIMQRSRTGFRIWQWQEEEEAAGTIQFLHHRYPLIYTM